MFVGKRGMPGPRTSGGNPAVHADSAGRRVPSYDCRVAVALSTPEPRKKAQQAEQAPVAGVVVLLGVAPVELVLVEGRFGLRGRGEVAGGAGRAAARVVGDDRGLVARSERADALGAAREIGGPAGIRTQDQGIHVTPRFPPGVDYLFTLGPWDRWGAGR